MKDEGLLVVIKRFIKYRFNLDEDKEDEQIIISSIKKDVEFKGASLWTLVFAILIASIGLDVNSTAVIIGAMLISPLMGPIMGIGLGVGIFDFELIKHALKNLLVAMLIGLLTSAIYFFITPIHQAQSELLARTSPTIWDVLIAFVGGLSGIVASTRKKMSNVIPGVAIATALMPPLCTAGYGLGTGNWAFFLGAIYLFFINTVFISISTFLIVRFLKFKAVEFVDSKRELKVRKYVAFIAILTILPSVYFAYKFVGQEYFKQKTENYITNEIKNKNFVVINESVDPIGKKISLILFGDKLTDTVTNEIISKKADYGLQDAVIIIKHNSVNVNPDLSQLKSGIIEDIYNKQEAVLALKDDRIRFLEKENESFKKTQLVDSSFAKEFNALFGSTQEIGIMKSPIYLQNNSSDTVLFVYIKPIKRNSHYDVSKIKNWVQVKMGIKEVKVLIDN